MGIKTAEQVAKSAPSHTLKNLPTTWGLRLVACNNGSYTHTLKNLPTTRG